MTPAGATFTPGSLTLPETEKLWKPLFPLTPFLANHSEPFSIISLIQNNVSRLLVRVGELNNPTSATYGGL